jgi:predicted dehydrogenase
MKDSPNISNNSRIGVIGSGFIVNDCHLPAYRKRGFHPVAIASRTRSSATEVARRHGIKTVHDDPASLLSDPSIEILDIAVPPQAQPGLILEPAESARSKGSLRRSLSP